MPRVQAALVMLFVMLAAAGVAHAHYDGELLPDSVALVEYRMVISMNPEDTLTRNKLGMVYIRQGKLDKAREEFTEILNMEPEDFDALDSLGIISEKEGKFEEAAGWFKKALEARPGDTGAASRLESVNKKLGR